MFPLLVQKVIRNNILARNAQLHIPTASLFTVQSAIEKWKQKLQNENIPESEAESSIENLIAHVLQTNSVQDVRKNVKQPLTDQQLHKLEQLCLARMSRMPVQYILGEWDFRNLKLKMVPPVFIPRPETEELVELILQQIDHNEEIEFLEIGCGSGAISLSLLKELPKAKSIALDQSKMACDLTRHNAQTLQLDNRLLVFQHKINDDSTNLPNDENGKPHQLFDLIVSNPPYVSTKDIHKLEPEITLYEDLRALDGGRDGMIIIVPILKLASKYLKPEALLWLEVDPSHPQLIEKYVQDHSELQLKYVTCYKDLFQKDRFVEIVKS